MPAPVRAEEFLVDWGSDILTIWTRDSLHVLVNIVR